MWITTPRARSSAGSAALLALSAGQKLRSKPSPKSSRVFASKEPPDDPPELFTSTSIA
jgi:hypothetical protein